MSNDVIKLSSNADVEQPVSVDVQQLISDESSKVLVINDTTTSSLKLVFAIMDNHSDAYSQLFSMDDKRNFVNEVRRLMS